MLRLLDDARQRAGHQRQQRSSRDRGSVSRSLRRTPDGVLADTRERRDRNRQKMDDARDRIRHDKVRPGRYGLGIADVDDRPRRRRPDLGIGDPIVPGGGPDGPSGPDGGYDQPVYEPWEYEYDDDHHLSFSLWFGWGHIGYGHHHHHYHHRHCWWWHPHHYHHHSWWHSWCSPSWSYWYGHWYYPFWPTFVYTSPTTIYVDSGSTDAYANDWVAVDLDLHSLGEAWQMLADGNYAGARSAFARLIGRDPEDGLRRIGHGLAAAALGDDVTAVYEMRSAIRVDPASLGEVPSDERVLELVAQTQDRYRDLVAIDNGDVDALFMLSATSFMLGADSMAYFAVDAAIGHGDEDESAYTLKALLEMALLEQIDDE